MDEDEVKTHMERHNFVEVNMTEQPDSVYSPNTHVYLRNTRGRVKLYVTLPRCFSRTLLVQISYLV